MSLGGLIALVVLFIAFLTAVNVINGAHLLWWCITGLALAILIGGFTIPWTIGRRA
jgi:hypothetical protein